MGASGRRAKTANEVAALFLAQRLAQARGPVRRGGAPAPGKGPTPEYDLQETWATGIFRAIISERQGAWLRGRMRRDRQSRRTVSFNGAPVGTWKYLGPGQNDPFARMEFALDRAFVLTFMQSDVSPGPPAQPTALPVTQLALAL
jgi:hypothetical protein